MASRSVKPHRDETPSRPVVQRHDDAADLREASLPDRVLHDDRDDVPAALEREHPGVVGDRRKEIGEDEDERSARKRRMLPREEVERVREIVLRMRETTPPRAASGSSCSDRGATHVACLVVEVEVAEKAARCERRLRDEIRRDAHGLGFREPR